jgi:hypothetical protein
VHTRLIFGFLEKHSNISKKTFILSIYKMQLATKKKKLIVCMVSNANFFSCYNGCIIRKIVNIVKILNEHVHTQVDAPPSFLIN